MLAARAHQRERDAGRSAIDGTRRGAAAHATGRARRGRAPRRASAIDHCAAPQPYSSTSAPSTSPSAPTSSSGMRHTPHASGRAVEQRPVGRLVVVGVGVPERRGCALVRRRHVRRREPVMRRVAGRGTDRAPVEQRGGDHERVEHLVVPEHAGPGVGPACRVHDRADRVEHAAAGDEQHALDPGALPEPLEPEHADPPEREVHGGDVAARSRARAATRTRSRPTAMVHTSASTTSPSVPPIASSAIGVLVPAIIEEDRGVVELEEPRRAGRAPVRAVVERARRRTSRPARPRRSPRRRSRCRRARSTTAMVPSATATKHA